MAEATNLGAWRADKDALESTRVTGRGSDADLPDLTRFLRGVNQLVLRRERIPEAEFDRPAAFALTSPEWLEAHELPAARHNPTLYSGAKPLTGQVHWVSAQMSGRSQPYAGDDADLWAVLKAADAQALPTIVYVPVKNNSKLMYFPKGIGADEAHELMDVAREAPTLESITLALERVHNQELRTPDQSGPFSLWQNAAKGWAHREAERRVQHALKCGLASAFPSCDIRSEQPSKVGRTDLEIVEEEGRPADQIVHHAVLELKVLREFGYRGGKVPAAYNRDHLKEGLDQASEYGEKKSMREKVLCAFDMRKKKAKPEVVFKHVETDATTLGVALRYWFLSRSSGALRKANVAAKTAKKR